MGTGTLDKSVTVPIAADGSARAQLQVPSGEQWTVSAIVISTLSQVPPPATCVIYRGTALIGSAVVASSSTGNNDAARGATVFLAGEIIMAVWADGVPNDRARLNVLGTVEGIGYR